MDANVAPKNIHEVNWYLREAGLRVHFRSGKTYYYGVDPGTGDVVGEAVNVYRASHLTFAQWESEARECLRQEAESQARFGPEV